MMICRSCNMAWGKDAPCACKCPSYKPEKQTPINVRELCRNPEPWEVEVAKIGEDRAEAIKERAKHVKFEVEIKSETVINLFVKPLEGPPFQIKAYKQSNVKNLMDDIDAYLHKNLQTCGDIGDAYIKKHDELLADNRLKIQYHGKTLEDDTMYDFENDDTITIKSVLSGEGLIRFICCFVPFCFHFK